MNLSTTDNNCGVSFDSLKGSKTDYQNLIKIANTTIEDLTKNNSNLLVFPKVLGEFRDGIEEQKVFELCGNSENLAEVKLTTGNLMGFVGIGDTQLKISSRFSKTDPNDYFMHYMLQKVFSINLFDYKYDSGDNGNLDLLMFTFPVLLKKALAQGMFKQYQTFQRNDSNVKGVIDVSRHIRMNIPFGGKIAYNSRERTFDNSVTQLIRHTIEAIKIKPFGKHVLNCDSETQKCISEIINATQSYSARDREKVISDNISPLNHPYFTAYKPLQKLCLSILRHKKIGYGSSKKKVYGVLFDGAWLWEEYLASVLKQCGFKHPKNKEGTGGISVYPCNTRYPDFYLGKQCSNQNEISEQKKKNFILDAKYKHLDNHKPNSDEFSGYFSRDDLHQIITYMYIMPADKAALIYPYDYQSENQMKCELLRTDPKTIYGYGGKITTFGVPIPVRKSYAEFSDFMENLEKWIKEYSWNF